jgi:hypothetical protein
MASEVLLASRLFESDEVNEGNEAVAQTHVMQ